MFLALLGFAVSSRTEKYMSVRAFPESGGQADGVMFGQLPFRPKLFRFSFGRISLVNAPLMGNFLMFISS